MLKLNKTPKGRRSRYLWDDIRKFEDYKQDYLYLRKNNITSKGELLEKISKLQGEMDELEKQRKPLYKQKRRENGEDSKEEIAEKIAELNASLKELRKELKVCERIIANLNHLQLEREEEIPKQAVKTSKTRYSVDRKHYSSRECEKN